MFIELFTINTNDKLQNTKDENKFTNIIIIIIIIIISLIIKFNKYQI